MENVTFIDVETLAGIETHALITLAEGSFISMLKSTYDEQQATALNGNKL
jgi:hypothetical protein